MFCPMCGKKLEIVSGDEDNYLNDIPVHYFCTGGCFDEDTPLLYHHPFHGINAASGDSWSLSWIK